MSDMQAEVLSIPPDNDYERITEQVSLLHPCKCYWHPPLSVPEHEAYQRIDIHFNIVELYSRIFCSRWPLFFDTWKKTKISFPFFYTVADLNDYRVHENTSHADSTKYSSGVRTRLRFISKDVCRKRKHEHELSPSRWCRRTQLGVSELFPASLYDWLLKSVKLRYSCTRSWFSN